MSSTILTAACCCGWSPPSSCSPQIQAIQSCLGFFPTSLHVEGVAATSFEQRQVCTTEQFGSDSYCASSIILDGHYAATVSGDLGYRTNPIGFEQCGYIGNLSYVGNSVETMRLGGLCPWQDPPDPPIPPDSYRTVAVQCTASIPTYLTLNAMGGFITGIAHDAVVRTRIVRSGNYCLKQGEINCVTDETLTGEAAIFAKFLPCQLAIVQDLTSRLSSSAGPGRLQSNTFIQGVPACSSVFHNGSLSITPQNAS